MDNKVKINIAPGIVEVGGSRVQKLGPTFLSDRGMSFQSGNMVNGRHSITKMGNTFVGDGNVYTRVGNNIIKSDGSIINGIGGMNDEDAFSSIIADLDGK